MTIGFTGQREDYCDECYPVQTCDLPPPTPRRLTHGPMRMGRRAQRRLFPN